jgi:hypothetical protein
MGWATVSAMTHIDVRTFKRIAADIRRRMEAGEWPPGTRIPSEGVVDIRLTGGFVWYRPQPTVVAVPPGGRVAARMPTPAECADKGIPMGVPVLTVTEATGEVSVYRADVTELSVPPPHRNPFGG